MGHPAYLCFYVTYHSHLMNHWGWILFHKACTHVLYVPKASLLRDSVSWFSSLVIVYMGKCSMFSMCSLMMVRYFFILSSLVAYSLLTWLTTNSESHFTLGEFCSFLSSGVFTWLRPYTKLHYWSIETPWSYRIIEAYPFRALEACLSPSLL